MNNLPRQSQEEKDFWCEEYDCLTMYLDKLNVESSDENGEYSLVGRVRCLVRRYHKTFEQEEFEGI